MDGFSVPALFDRSERAAVISTKCSAVYEDYYGHRTRTALVDTGHNVGIRWQSNYPADKSPVFVFALRIIDIPRAITIESIRGMIA